MAKKNKKAFKWVVEFTVAEKRVADGFDPDSEQVKDMILSSFGYADEAEVSAKMLKRPKNRQIASAQGYNTVDAYRRDNWKGRKRF